MNVTKRLARGSSVVGLKKALLKCCKADIITAFDLVFLEVEKVSKRVPLPQPHGKNLCFLEASVAFEGIGSPGVQEARQTHLENILLRGSKGTQFFYFS